MLVNVPRLITAYYTEVPNPQIPAQRVAFGTSGHRGSSLKQAFNEWHILAQCDKTIMAGLALRLGRYSEEKAPPPHGR